MSVTVMPSPVFTGLDDNGNPIAGGLLYTYEAGTVNLKDTYADIAETPNANPVVLDAAGRAVVFLGTGAYKFVLHDADDVLVWEQDDVLGYLAVGIGDLVLDTLSVTTSITLAATKKLRLDGDAVAGDTYLVEASANTIKAYAGGVDVLTIAATAVTSSQDVILASTKKLYLDGGVDTYLVEASANTIKAYAGGVDVLTIAATAVTSSQDVILAATKKLYLDGGGNTYLVESAADVLKVYVGGTLRMQLDASGLTIGVATVATVRTVSSVTAQIATATPTTIFSALAAGHYRVVAYLNGTNAALYASFATVVSTGTTARIVADNGASLTLTLSGTDVQVTQSSGSNQAVTYAYVMMS